MLLIYESDIIRVSTRLTFSHLSNGIEIDLSIYNELFLIGNLVSRGCLIIDGILAFLMRGNLYLKHIPCRVRIAAGNRRRIFIYTIPVCSYLRVFNLVECDITLVVLLRLDVIPFTFFEFIEFESIYLLFCRFFTIDCLVKHKTNCRRNQTAALIRVQVAFTIRISAVDNHAAAVVTTLNNEISVRCYNMAKFRSNIICNSYLFRIGHIVYERHSCSVFGGTWFYTIYLKIRDNHSTGRFYIDYCSFTSFSRNISSFRNNQIHFDDSVIRIVCNCYIFSVVNINCSPIPLWCWNISCRIGKHCRRVGGNCTCQFVPIHIIIIYNSLPCPNKSIFSRDDSINHITVYSILTSDIYIGIVCFSTVHSGAFAGMTNMTAHSRIFG